MHEAADEGFDYRAVQAVAIGASAGGVDALNVLLPALARDFAPAVLVVVHMRADAPSLLAKLFAARCALPVVEPLDKEEIRGGHVYIAPPGYHMLIEAGRTIALSVDPPVRFSRPSVDVMYEAAAWVYRDALLGILLSGANSDGTAGMAAIRADGGRCWVQAPETASASVMPRSAIACGAAHDILTLEAMAAKLRDGVGRRERR